MLEIKADYEVPSASSQSSFWLGATLGQLAKAQGVRPVRKLEDLYGDFWPDEDYIDEAIRGLDELRRRDRFLGGSSTSVEWVAKPFDRRGTW